MVSAAQINNSSNTHFDYCRGSSSSFCRRPRQQQQGGAIKTYSRPLSVRPFRSTHLFHKYASTRLTASATVRVATTSQESMQIVCNHCTTFPRHCGTTPATADVGVGAMSPRWHWTWQACTAVRSLAKTVILSAPFSSSKKWMFGCFVRRSSVTQ